MPRRAMYHVALDDEKIQGARFALLPGDPLRSKLIAERIGSVYGAPVPDGPLAQFRVHTFIRVGTAGAIQDSTAIGDVVVTTGSVRLDGASADYAPVEYPAVAHPEVMLALVMAAKSLAGTLGCRYHVGVTASTDTFYQGQEREDDCSRYIPRRLRGMTEERRRLHVLNVEMESSTLLTMCGALGLRGGCVTGVINMRATDRVGEPITPEQLRPGEAHAVMIGIKAIGIMITNALPL